MPPSHSASIEIAAPPERVWELVTDVTRMGRISPECVGGEWLAGATGPEVGARFRGYNRRGRARWTTTSEVIEAEPGRVFAFAVGGAARPSCTWRYRLEPVDGGTRVTETFELPRPLPKLQAAIVRFGTGVRDREDDLRHNVERTLEALKSTAETAERA